MVTEVRPLRPPAQACRLPVDGVERGSSGPSNYTGSTGELAGRFVDLRANSVSGGVSVLRRATESIVNDEEWDA